MVLETRKSTLVTLDIIEEEGRWVFWFRGFGQFLVPIFGPIYKTKQIFDYDESCTNDGIRRKNFWKYKTSLDV